jgi:hypothetical protein
MWRFDKDSNQQAHHTSLHQQGVSLLLWISLGPMRSIESGAQTFDPILSALLRFVVDGDIDGIQIDNFLKTDGDNIGRVSSILAPIATNPFFQRFFLALGIHIPRSDKQKGLNK